MTIDRDQILKTLYDRAMITECMHRYALALDNRDVELMRSCFHPDSTHEHGAFTGLSHDFCAFAVNLSAGCERTHHLVGNVSIDVSGSTAKTSAYFVGYHRMRSDGPPVFVQADPGDDVFICGRYYDRFEEREGTWRIAHRLGVREWARFERGDDRGATDPVGSTFNSSVAAMLGQATD